MPVAEKIESGIKSEANCRKKWTVEEAEKIAELFPEERYELIEGDLINKMGERPSHGYVLSQLIAVLAVIFPGMVRIQSSMRLPKPDGQYTEPLPDVVILRANLPELKDRLPAPEDVALIIEVSDTSFRLDRKIKYRLYARAGIPEYWVVNIPERRIHVCRNPAGEEYKSVAIVEAHEQASLIGTRFVISFNDLVSQG